MEFKYGSLGIRVDDRYRTIPEAKILSSFRLGGWPFELNSEAAKTGVQQVLDSWVDLGLGFTRAPDGGRLFDPVEVDNFMRRVRIDGRSAFFTERFVLNHRRMVAELTQTDSSSGRERRFALQFKRTFSLRSVPAGTKLRLRAPLPVSGDNIEITPFAETAKESEIKLSPGRLELRMVASGEAEAVLGATMTFTSRLQEPHPGDASGDIDRAVYLNAKEGFIVITDRIRALAQTLAGNGTSPRQAMYAFWEYINDNMNFGSVHYDQIDLNAPSEWALDSGWFDCQMGGSLLVALCRARGIPARMCSGHLLYRVAPGKHYWSEVWIDGQGWTPVDFIGWDLSDAGRDKEWRDHLFGRLDYRLVFERMPHEFTGALGIPLPQEWTILQVPKEGGVEVNITQISGEPVYSDFVRIEK